VTAQETLCDGTQASPTGPAIPTVLPWHYALTICAAALVRDIAGHA